MGYKFLKNLIILAFVLGATLSACTAAPVTPTATPLPPTPTASLPGGHTTTTWSVEPNMALDTLCFIPTLTGDSFYMTYYYVEYRRFAEKLTPEVKDALAKIQTIIEQRGSLISTTLTQLFLPLAPKNLDDLLRALDNPETIRLGVGLSSDDETWQLVSSHLPNLRLVIGWLKEVGFEKDYVENFLPQIQARAEELGRKVAEYNIVPSVEAAIGMALPSDKITIYLSHYVLPFGIGMAPNQFLFYSNLDLNSIIDNSIHENLHVIDIQEPALWDALSFLQQDAYYMKNFQSHDFSAGYATFEQYLEEDVIEGLDQFLAEAVDAAENPRTRWMNVLPGMHKLSPVLYTLLKQENYSPELETYHDFLIRIVKEGKLKSGMIESANRQFFAAGQ